MSETQTNGTKSKKIVSRGIAIALVICIILLAALGVVAYWGSAYVASHHYTDDKYDSLQRQIYELNKVGSLSNWTVWVEVSLTQMIGQPPNSYTSWNFSAAYAGYIIVSLYYSTDIYVEVTYNYSGSQWLSEPPYSWLTEPFHYDQRIDVAYGPEELQPQVLLFPVLPATIQIRVGNTNSSLESWEALTITYFY
jgi:hypothetical protein